MAHGFAPVVVQEASLEEWDAYFRGYRGVLGLAYLQLLAV